MDASEAAARRSRERSPKRQKYLDQRKIKDDSTENYEKLAQDTLTRLDLHEELFNELNERRRLKARAEVLLAHAENLVETMKQQPDTDLIAQKRLFAQKRVSVAYLQRLVEEGGEHADRIARLNKALNAYGTYTPAKRSYTEGTALPTAESEEVAKPTLVSAKKKLSPKQPLSRPPEHLLGNPQITEDNSYTYTHGKQYNEGSAVSPVGSQEVAAPPTAESEEVAKPTLVSAKKKLSPKQPLSRPPEHLLGNPQITEDNSYTYTHGKQYNEGSAVSPVGSQEVAGLKRVPAKMKARPKQPLDPPPEHLLRRNKRTQDDLYKTSSGSGSSWPKQHRECPRERLLCSAGNLGCYDEVKQWQDRCGKQGGAYSL